MREVNRVKIRDRLDLDDYPAFDEEIDVAGAIDTLASEGDGNRDLTFDFEPASKQQRLETRFVRGLEKPRHQLSVHVDRVPDDGLRDVVDPDHGGALVAGYCAKIRGAAARGEWQRWPRRRRKAPRDRAVRIVGPSVALQQLGGPL
jgi:hypothetical protein